MSNRTYLAIRWLLRTALLLVWTGVGCFSASDGQTAPANQPPQSVENSGGPPTYCGVYCLSRAMSALGKEVAFRDLLRPEYIGSGKGSSAEELTKAAADFGLYCRPIDHMTSRGLRAARSPVVLHVKSSLGASEYDHWILFMGTEGGKARIYDGAEPVRLVEFEELAVLWDGTGLVLSNVPIRRIPMVVNLAVPYAFFSGIVLFSVAVMRSVEQRLGKCGRHRLWSATCANCAAQVASILAVAVVLGVAYRVSHPEGFLSYRPAIAAIRNAKLATFLPKVSPKEIPTLQSRSDIVFVDARIPTDFEADHLDGAINLPPYSTLDQCRRGMAHVPRNSRVVVYCHSSGCPYSERTARKLVACGFRNLMLFEGGWLAWEEYQRNSQR